ncbi:MAG: triose-phosphate isomerase [Pseudomonadota bacterium]
MARKLAAGNWKMNGTSAALAEAVALAEAHPEPECDVLLCPPVSLLHRMGQALAGTAIRTGGQDCHANASGAHTGDVSAEMLADAGATYVILGHSERRADHGETDSDVAEKVSAARRAGLIAVLCVGETEAQRDAGDTLKVVSTQLAGSLPTGVMAESLVVAYEPVWAIGTGRTPTLDEIAEVHDHLRDELSAAIGSGARDVPLLYGGSVKPGNAVDIFGVSNVDGALVGGASLKASDFSAIVRALEASS